ncbi:MAG: NADH-quinone oxidoreductase subunit NuoE [Nitratireductor sp.]|jgi:NADH-quinone oxidoreductase subunit E|nr:NADH-quinone oxidoreductase subunit NuoE [Nitratireductor sp.]
MTVRRLAPDEVQPARFAFGREKKAEAKKWIAKYPDGRQASAVIPLLMLAQEQEGWVTKAAIEEIANILTMPYIRVLEVATFYTQFQLHPVGTRAHVQVCGTTPCMLRGAQELIEVCRHKINPDPFVTNDSGTLSWEEVECQGACVNAPMVMIFKDTYEDLTPERLAEIIDAFEAGKGASVPPGPQVDRIFSAPQGGLTSLKSDPAKGGGKARAGNGGDKGQKPTNAAKPKQAAEVANPAIKTPVPAAKARTVKQNEKPIAVTLDDPRRPAKIERPANPDNLQLISGVGPKIEKTLHDLGIFTYAQIAEWKKAEREWVDSYLAFSGRIEREDWVKQAKALAKGGEAEYIRVFGKKPR